MDWFAWTLLNTITWEGRERRWTIVPKDLCLHFTIARRTSRDITHNVISSFLKPRELCNAMIGLSSSNRLLTSWNITVQTSWRLRISQQSQQPKAKDVSGMTPKKRYQQLFTMSEHFVRWRQDGTGHDIATAKPGHSLRPFWCQPMPVYRGGRDTWRHCRSVECSRWRSTPRSAHPHSEVRFSHTLLKYWHLFPLFGFGVIFVYCLNVKQNNYRLSLNSRCLTCPSRSPTKLLR